MASSKDALGRQISFAYDSQGRLVRTTHPDGGFEETGYDAEGRRISSKDRAGRVTSLEYDALGRLIKTTPLSLELSSFALESLGMLISDQILASLNAQIGNEFNAMLQYVAIAAHFDSETLPFLSAHFFKQAEEEKEHAHKFIKFILDTGGKVVIPAIAAPQASFDSAAAAVTLSLEQEKKVSQQINQLVHMAKEESDYTTDSFLVWFVQEQLEEVSSMQDLLSIVQRAGEDNLLRVEEYLARRGGNMSGFPSSTSAS